MDFCHFDVPGRKKMEEKKQIDQRGRELREEEEAGILKSKQTPAGERGRVQGVYIDFQRFSPESRGHQRIDTGLLPGNPGTGGTDRRL